MTRTTKIVGFSLPPETHSKLEKLIKSQHKTRSEFFRGMIDVYLNTFKNTSVKQTRSDISNVSESDLAQLLRSYWVIKSQNKLNVIIVGSAIITDKKEHVLIGARSEKDMWVENLTWAFPGGAMHSLDFESELKEVIKKKTNLDITVNNIVSSRIHPDSGFKTTDIVILFFHCTPVSTKILKTSKDLPKLKWVKPSDVFKYFTTSTNDEVTRFLMTLEKANA